MKSIDCFKLEDGDLQLSLSSNLVANYDYDHPNNISNGHSTVIESLITDTNSFPPLLRNNVRSVLEFELLNNTTSFLPLVRNNVRSDNDLNFDERSTIGKDDFSQSTACIAT